MNRHTKSDEQIEATAGMTAAAGACDEHCPIFLSASGRNRTDDAAGQRQMPEEPFPRMTQKRINRDEILMRYHADTAGAFTILQQIFVLEWYA